MKKASYYHNCYAKSNLNGGIYLVKDLFWCIRELCDAEQNCYL